MRQVYIEDGEVKIHNSKVCGKLPPENARTTHYPCQITEPHIWHIWHEINPEARIKNGTEST